MAKETAKQKQNEALLIDPDIVAGKTEAAKPASKPKKADKKKPVQAGAKYTWGTGRRKSSIARVRIRPGNGKLLINKRKVNDYFTQQHDRNVIIAPLKALKAEKKFDIFVNVKGGGTSGQAGATMLGIARALRNYDEGYLKELRDGGFLTRDSRMVERKKRGQRGARRKFQFSKR